MANFKTDGTYLLVGKTNTGKTTFLKALLTNLGRQFDLIVGFSKTKFKGSINYCPPQFQFDDWNEDKIEKLMNWMQHLVKYNIKVAIILDDMIGDIKVHNNRVFDKLATRCRHYNITLFIVSQYLLKLSPPLRSNANYLICTRMTREDEIKCLWKEFGSSMDWPSFKDKFMMDTYNFGVFVIDNSGPEVKFQGMRCLSNIAPFRIPISDRLIQLDRMIQMQSTGLKGRRGH